MDSWHPNGIPVASQWHLIHTTINIRIPLRMNMNISFYYSFEYKGVPAAVASLWHPSAFAVASHWHSSGNPVASQWPNDILMASPVAPQWHSINMNINSRSSIRINFICILIFILVWILESTPLCTPVASL